MVTEVSAQVSMARKAARGTLALLARQAITLIVTLAGGVLLARLLTPAEFGSYALIVFVSSLTKLLVDGGLGASLIQQEREPTRNDRAVVFSFQLLTAVILAIGIVALASSLQSELGAVEGTGLSLCFAAIAIVAAPFTSISIVILERNLSFVMLGIILAIQPIAFNILAVWLASTGFGVLSLGIALAISNLIVVPVAIWAVQEVPALRFKPRELIGRFQFSLPFIGTNLVSTIKDAVNPLYVGLFVGASAVGYVNWAQQVAIIGMYILVVISRLLFPVFARVKDDKTALPEAVSKILFWANMMVAPIAVFIGLFAEEFTIALYGDQWMPAIPMLYWLLLTNLISPTSSVLMALMNAIGRPSVGLWFAIAWFAATWLLVPVFVSNFGMVGYGYANVCTNLISVALIPVARKFVDFRWGRALVLPWVYTAVAFAVIALPGKAILGTLSIAEAGALGAVSVVMLVGITWLLSRSRIQYLWRSVFK